MLPRARVRRLYGAPLEAPREPQLKLRPFTHYFTRNRWLGPLFVEGQLQATGYRVSVGPHQVLLFGISTGNDAYGPFALAQPQEHVLCPLTVLRVEADATDGAFSHAALSYVEVARDRRARQELAFAERWFSVYFNPLGLVDGAASGGPESVPPPPTPS